MTTSIIAAAVVAAGGAVAVSPAVASPGQRIDDLTTVTPESLVGAIAGPGVRTGHVVYTGDPRAAGVFSGFDTIGLDGGLVLSTGAAATAVGPNRTGAMTTKLYTPGDADLDALAGVVTQDAASLTFDVIPATSELEFDYVFASDEYGDAASAFADPVGLWVNGVNCAVTPDGAPVSSASVNDGLERGTVARNADLYRDNTPVTWESQGRTSPVDVEADGLTTVLHCHVDVVAGARNTLKLAIADAAHVYTDSQVFIAAGSLRSVGGAPAGGAEAPAPVPTESAPAPTPAPSPVDEPAPAPADPVVVPVETPSAPTDPVVVPAPADPAGPVVEPAPIVEAPVAEAVVSVDTDAADALTAPVSTAGPDRLLLAFVSLDGLVAEGQHATVTGGDLDWTLVSRANSTGGTAEIWQARAPEAIADAAVTASFSQGGFGGSLTVAAFAHATVGASAATAGESAVAATSLSDVTASSLVWGVGHNWSRAEAPAVESDQAIAHLFVEPRAGDTYWTQALVAPASVAPVTVGATVTAGDRWQFAAVEIAPRS